MSVANDTSYSLTSSVKVHKEDVVLSDTKKVYYINEDIICEEGTVVVYGHGVILDPKVLIKAKNVFIKGLDFLERLGTIEAETISGKIPKEWEKSFQSSNLDGKIQNHGPSAD